MKILVVSDSSSGLERATGELPLGDYPAGTELKCLLVIPVQFESPESAYALKLAEGWLKGERTNWRRDFLARLRNSHPGLKVDVEVRTGLLLDCVIGEIRNCNHHLLVCGLYPRGPISKYLLKCLIARLGQATRTEQ